jgi:hypothetical protein
LFRAFVMNRSHSKPYGAILWATYQFGCSLTCPTVQLPKIQDSSFKQNSSRLQNGKHCSLIILAQYSTYYGGFKKKCR